MATTPLTPPAPPTPVTPTRVTPTTLHDLPGVVAVRHVLGRARARLLAGVALRALLIAAAAATAGFIVLALLMAAWPMLPIALVRLVAVAVPLAAVGLYATIEISRWGDDRLAWLVERQLQATTNPLISVLQLASDSSYPASWRARAIAEAARDVDRLDLRNLTPATSWRRPVAALAALVVLGAAAALASWSTFEPAVRRLLGVPGQGSHVQPGLTSASPGTTSSPASASSVANEPTPTPTSMPTPTATATPMASAAPATPAPAALPEEATPGQADPTPVPGSPAAKIRASLDTFAAEQRDALGVLSPLTRQPPEALTAADRTKLSELADRRGALRELLAEVGQDVAKLPIPTAGQSEALQQLSRLEESVAQSAEQARRAAVQTTYQMTREELQLARQLADDLKKWLPTEPEWVQWQMLAPEDAPPEVPLVALPTRLDDLVGDLLEEENELLDEVQDASSQVADSISAAGDEVRDGPASNFSAKGATGNELPNQNEIGGRSGEGREGQASGEMVEAQAVGKAGRTPRNRVTADAQQAGHIDDRSGQSGQSGLATGGGKAAGLGQEGATRPLPPDAARTFEQLRGRQAELRLASERLLAQIPGDLPPAARLGDAVTLMGQVEADLGQFAYENALRRREALIAALNDARSVAGGVTVTHLPAVELTPEVIDHLADAQRLPRPAGYEALIAEYYRRLSAGPKRP